MRAGWRSFAAPPFFLSPAALEIALPTQPSKLANPAHESTPCEWLKPPVITAEKQADWSSAASRASRARVKASKNTQTRTFAGFPDAVKAGGTALAFKGKEKGSAIACVYAPVRRGKRSAGLTRKEVENILAAGVYTLEKHRGLNRFTTIHFEAAGISDPVKATSRLIKLASDWLRTKGEELSYIWVREAGEGKGDHVHLLWSVPPNLARDFAMRERGWRKLIRAKRRAGAIKSVPIGLNLKHAIHEIQYGEHYSKALEGLLSYILKAATPKTAKALGLPFSGLGGEVWGKRCGMSENINRAARSRGLK